MSGARCTRRPRSMLRFVRIRSSQARRLVPGWKERHERNARAYASCIRSSASSRVDTSLLATRYTWSARSSASSSKRTRSRASSASFLGSASGVVSPIAATLAIVSVSLWNARGRLVIPVSGRAAAGAAAHGRLRLDRFELAGAALGHRGQDRLAIGLLVVPLQQHLAHQVRVRELEALVAAQRAREAADAALAADAADLDRLGASHL